MDCPKCLGLLEKQVTDEGERYRCFVCDWLSPVGYGENPDQRLRRRARLTLDFVFRPWIAIPQIVGQPPWLSVLLIAVLFSLISALGSGQQIQQLPEYVRLAGKWPALKNPTALPLVIFFFFWLGTTLSAICLHWASLLLGGSARFKTLWTCLLLLATVSGAANVLLPRSLHSLSWGVTLWSWGLTLLIMKSLYRFDWGLALGSWVISWIFRGGLLFLLGLLGIFSAFQNPRLMEKGLRSPTLTRLHEPADYQGTLQTLDGSFLKMEDLRGKVVFLNFWATWCFPCRLEMPSIQRLYDQLKQENRIVIVCVSDQKMSDIKKFLKRNPYTFPVYRSSDLRSRRYASTGIPATFILSPQGEIVARHEGAGRWDTPEMVQFLRSLLKE